MRKLTIIKILLLMLVLYACVRNPAEEQDSSCNPNKDGASVVDFVGTWVARRSIYPLVNDTLIIKVDGTYKQIINIESPETTYESEWLPWRIVYNEYGVLYLFMEGMTLCGYDRTENCAPEMDGVYYEPCYDTFENSPENGVMLLSYRDTLQYISSSIRGWVYLRQE